MYKCKNVTIILFFISNRSFLCLGSAKWQIHACYFLKCISSVFQKLFFRTRHLIIEGAICYVRLGAHGTRRGGADRPNHSFGYPSQPSYEGLKLVWATCGANWTLHGVPREESWERPATGRRHLTGSLNEDIQLRDEQLNTRYIIFETISSYVSKQAHFIAARRAQQEGRKPRREE